MMSLTCLRTAWSSGSSLRDLMARPASLAMSCGGISRSTAASVGTSPPKSILAKTRPNCQTLPGTPTDCFPSASGACRNSEPAGGGHCSAKHNKRSSVVSFKQACWKLVITARRSPSTRYTFPSVKSPWTMLKCSMLWRPRNKSIMSGNACFSGTAGPPFARNDRSCTKAWSVRLPTCSVIMNVASGNTCRSKKVGTQPVWLKSWDTRSSRTVSGMSERPAMICTWNSGLARSFAEAT
mmetsp:Transcript_48774/g.137193  ORF Transcript_48774/g.137193 Transcript_48774/m.137193 type:complete len:238 (-) Transcript_48774:215-928(-)